MIRRPTLTLGPEAHERRQERIGGALSTEALARFHFHALAPTAQTAAIRRLAAAGQGEHTIAHATGLSVDMIRRVLAASNANNQGNSA
jgi:hypothetical protein